MVGKKLGEISGKGDAATTSDKVSSTLLGTGVGILTAGLLPEEYRNATAKFLYNTGEATGNLAADAVIGTQKWLKSDQLSENAEQMEEIKRQRLKDLDIEQQTAKNNEIERIKRKQERGKELTELEKLQLNRNTDEGEQEYQKFISNKDNLSKMDSSELTNVSMIAENELTIEREKTQATTDAAKATMTAAATKNQSNGIKKTFSFLMGDVASFSDDVPEILKNKKFREIAESDDPEQVKKANKMMSQEIKNLQKERDQLSGWSFIAKKKYNKQINNLREYLIANQNRIKALEQLKKKEQQTNDLKNATEAKIAEEDAAYGLTPDEQTTGNAEESNISIEEGKAVEHTPVTEETGELSTEQQSTENQAIIPDSIKTGTSDIAAETTAKAGDLQTVTNNAITKTAEKEANNIKTQEILIQELQKRDAIMETYLNPNSPNSINKTLENNITKISDGIQPIYSFPTTRTDNIAHPTTII